MNTRSQASTRGLELRARSIRIGFKYQGKWCRERLNLDPDKPANLQYATRLRNTILKEIDKGTFSYEEYFPTSPRAHMKTGKEPKKVKEYLNIWLRRIQPLVKASTFQGYRIAVTNQIIPALGRKRLDQITRPMVQDWLVSLNVSQKRAANLLSPLRMALRDAVDENLIPANPLDGWRFRSAVRPREKAPVDPFTADEQAAILRVFDAATPGRAPRMSDRVQGKHLIQFALWTGLRTSELVALEWGDIDWVSGNVAVSRALTQASKEPEGTKTQAGTRFVKLLPPALEALKAQKAFTFLADGRVFHNPRTNEPWTGDQAIRKTLWAPALKLAGVRYRKPYQTRHTYASMMLSAGEPLAWVSRQLGHSSVLTTAQVYARWIPDSMPEVGNRAVAIFRKEGNDS